ncbi:c-type cytochrome [Massilia sp. B-10]|nr:c-type cytochrome [Massilia sp. B-10]
MTTTKLEGAGTDSQSAAAVETRIHPVADEGYTLKDANAPKVLLAKRRRLHRQLRSLPRHRRCLRHRNWAKLADWTKRIAQGAETLFKHAIGGLNAMPAKGGNPDLDDVEIKRAVVYMANKGGAKFDEPKAPEAAAPAAAPAAEAAPAAAAAAKQRRPQQHQPPSQPKSPSMARKYSTQSCAACHGA